MEVEWVEVVGLWALCLGDTADPQSSSVIDFHYPQ